MKESNKDLSWILVIAAVAAFIYFKNKGKKTPVSVTEPPITATPILAPQFSGEFPFVKTFEPTLNVEQITPTPASILNPQQLQQYNKTGNIILAENLKNFNPCYSNATTGISGKIYTC